MKNHSNALPPATQPLQVLEDYLRQQHPDILIRSIARKRLLLRKENAEIWVHYNVKKNKVRFRANLPYDLFVVLTFVGGAIIPIAADSITTSHVWRIVILAFLALCIGLGIRYWYINKHRKDLDAIKKTVSDFFLKKKQMLQ